MILLIPKNGWLSALANNVADKSFEPILYSIDELSDTSFQIALDNHSQVEPELYSSKMTPLYVGYRKKDDRGKYRVYPLEVAKTLFKGSQKAPQVP